MPAFGLFDTNRPLQLLRLPVEMGHARGDEEKSRLEDGLDGAGQASRLLATETSKLE
ncbi:hypothetical protein MAMC_02098 [Methylacidimicrobium cyclopophantes]|uniref:Uncharacterized protein n=1 Tax=Methylacidimicrobium cyclopophantes TaxID=1041766 RepID=A0A5E6MRA6_9BACT|nr:hypothetical protein MAMC_02098 [Methylacidimicrobium cyclopophantes]